jgi:NAD(P)-dependent dehydrogenase (short-subunit alcohol dehydrogenase family)
MTTATTVLLTHVRQYTGPGTLPVLLREGTQPFCHDASFADSTAALAFEAEQPGAVALRGQTPEQLAAELQQRCIDLDVVVSNDVFPNTPYAIEEVPMQVLRDSFEALLAFPFRLTQLLLPAMKRAKKGRFVFVTSARYLQPEYGYSVATAIRAGTTAFAGALAKEAAPFGIQVNVVAPNYLYSETYYPRARFIDDPAGRAQIAAKVPLGRLGEPQEVGELIVFLVSGRAAFVTGQVINFTGGWPG